MSFTTRPTLSGSFGMVSSSHWLASAAGMRALELGGNAFDAAVSAAFVLHVVEPHMNGPAGDLSAIVYPAGRERPLAVCGQGPAPAAATSEHFRELGLELVPGTGVLPACVPGAFGAWMLLLGELGTFRLRDALALAIDYAEDGYPVLAQTSAAIAEVEALFRKHWTTSAEIYLAGGVPAPGSRARNPLLAATLRRIVAEAERASADRDEQIAAAHSAFYEGFVADAIERHLSQPWATDLAGTEHRGLLAPSDMASWRPALEEPATLPYRDLTICKTSTWGQGPVMLQQLSLLEGLELDGMQRGGAEYVHTVVECAKLAFADREAWYGDPAFVDVPLSTLLSPAYAAARRELVAASASGELRPGSPDGREPQLAARVGGDAGAAGVGEPTTSLGGAAGVGEPTTRLGDTCHIDVMDRFGNAVAATPSGGWLQSSPAIAGLGFSLGTRAQMFWIEPGLAGSLAPGKRPRTTLSPTLVLRDGRPSLAFGTPGGDQQDQWSLTFLLAHLHFGLDLQAAIDEPAFHTRAFPSSFFPRAASAGTVDVEGRFAPAAVAELRRRGHDVTVLPDWDRSRVSAVAREPDGTLHAAASPRGMQAYAVGR